MPALVSIDEEVVLNHRHRTLKAKLTKRATQLYKFDSKELGQLLQAIRVQNQAISDTQHRRQQLTLEPHGNNSEVVFPNGNEFSQNE